MPMPDDNRSQPARTMTYPLEQLKLFITGDSECSYLPGEVARNIVADPEAIEKSLYDQLIQFGFRRSGDYLYRPRCDRCRACQSLRVDAVNFRVNRSQRRCAQRNGDLDGRWVRAEFVAAHFELYSRYVAARHPDGGMSDGDESSYREFFFSHWSDTRMYELRDRQTGSLKAVAVVDRLQDGLSAVYTFFDPDCHARGLGNLMVLRLIEETLDDGLKWLYLGYWVRDCRKMAYKSTFQPYQYYDGVNWCWGQRA